MKRHSYDDVAFEDSLNDDWGRDLDVAEVPIGNRPLAYLGVAVAAVIAAVAFQVIFLNWSAGAYYRARAEDNVAQYAETPAPRGIIYDREGDVLAESKAAFAAVLDVRSFIHDAAARTSTLEAAQNILGLSPGAVDSLVTSSAAEDFATPIVLRDNLTPSELVNLQALSSGAIKIESDFVRSYPNGPAFASVVGYTGRVTQNDLAADSSLHGNDFIGKAGVEAYYDKMLRGTPGITVEYRDAQGHLLRTETKSTPQIGTPLHLTIDGGLQAYLAARLGAGLRALGRTVGFGIAMDPRNGQILALADLPGFDNNLFSGSGTSTSAAIQALLASPDKPLFTRAVAGYYNPGSTIKPLDAVAGLTEGVITPERTVFSNGVLLVPNPYDPSTPSRYLDWQYQGTVNLASALAQSSDVYFYLVGGGSPPESVPLLNDPSDYGIKGLGIDRLHSWWEKFGLGKPTGVDLPGEAAGFLPTPAWKQAHSGTPWLLGDTYNVSIGQGDLLLGPLQLLSYINAIANGGTIWRPFVNTASTPQVDENLTSLAAEIVAVQRGMVAGVATPRGTAYTMHDLPFCAAAKTGSAQVKNNAEENALFVGYAPCNNPQISLLILIENSKQGSLNAVPIAKDVMNWYYVNRMATATTTAVTP